MIIGISITAVTGALSAAAGLSAKADHAVDAVRILKNILNNPEIMKEIVENKTFEKAVDNEDGWVCRTEVSQLVINSGDIGVYIEGESIIEESSGEAGEDIEIPGMLNATVCVTNTHGITEKSYCIERWVQER